jgi:hypothetical protein
MAARIGDDPATLLRWYTQRMKKADSSAAGVIVELTKGVLEIPEGAPLRGAHNRGGGEHE